MSMLLMLLLYGSEDANHADAAGRRVTELDDDNHRSWAEDLADLQVKVEASLAEGRIIVKQVVYWNDDCRWSNKKD